MAFHPPAATPPGLWRRTPPAIFPAIMGLFGLGLAWRRASAAFGLPDAPGEAILGAVTLLFLFAAMAYVGKVLRRPKVVVEELRVLPGRAGVAAAVLCVYLVSLTVLPYDPAVARGALYAGLALHVLLVGLVLYVLATGPAVQRRVTPVWHLTFTGFIIAALAATGLQIWGIALILFGLTALMAAVIWSVSLEQIVREDVPPPLRPLVAIHLAPMALIGLVAEGMEFDAVAMGCGGVAALMLVWLLARGFWLTAAGFSALWGAFTFPVAATAALWLTLGGLWRWPGLAALVFATIIIPPIVWQVLRAWARGQLAIKTNAAIA
ncbi:MAG: tellurium resistance protein [Albidovulum sp.]